MIILFHDCAFRDEKERWIRGKYVDKEFLPPAPYVDIPLNQVS